MHGLPENNGHEDLQLHVLGEHLAQLCRLHNRNVSKAVKMLRSTLQGFVSAPQEM